MVASGGPSPLLGALYRTPLDRRMDRLCKGKRLVQYVRYMDDMVLLARTRWELRRAIAALHEEIATLGLHLHRVKRLIGRTTQGFDFLGYRIRAGARLRPSAEGLRRLRERARRLHEREGDWQRLRQYVLRWQRWHWGGLDGIVSRKGGAQRSWQHVLTHLELQRPSSCETSRPVHSTSRRCTASRAPVVGRFSKRPRERNGTGASNDGHRASLCRSVEKSPFRLECR